MTERAFEPRDHLRVFTHRQRQPDGSYKQVQTEYLDVKWRVVWFRTEHPNGNIVTQLLTTPGVSPAVVQATVKLENGVTATGLGQCGQDDWSDWLEKAETRAIGRALALLGYGTQFCGDFDEVISDAPINRQTLPPRSRNGSSGKRVETGELMTQNQRNYLMALARDGGMTTDELEELANQRYGHGLDMLLKSEASELIGSLQVLRDERTEADASSPTMISAANAGLLTDRQTQAIERLRAKQQMSDRDLIGYASNLLQRDVTSIVELTAAEAGELIMALSEL